MNEKLEECQCELLKMNANDPSVPIIYHQELNEYHIHCSDDKYLVIKFCHHCGAPAPASHRDEKFLTPDVKEEEEIRKTLKDARSVGDVFASIGAADTTDKDSILDENIRQTLVYNRLWKSVDLIITEYLDGTISYSMCAKLK